MKRILSILLSLLPVIGGAVTGSDSVILLTGPATGTGAYAGTLTQIGAAMNWGAGGAGLGYTLPVQAITSSPTDAQTIYFGSIPRAPATAAATSKVRIPATGTITKIYLYCYSGTAGTNEAWSVYVRLNNTTDTLIATVSSATNEREFNNAGLSIAVTAGDYIEIKSVNPTWVTNPLTCIFGGIVYVQ